MALQAVRSGGVLSNTLAAMEASYNHTLANHENWFLAF